jgi:hypothetical protein
MQAAAMAGATPDPARQFRRSRGSGALMIDVPDLRRRPADNAMITDGMSTLDERALR